MGGDVEESKKMTIDVPDSKQCVLFRVQIRDREIKRMWGFKCVNFYGFDSLFSPVKEEDSSEPDKDSYTVNLEDKLAIANPLITLDRYSEYGTYACRKNRIYRVGGTEYSDDEDEELEKWEDPDRRLQYLLGKRVLSKFSKDVEYWNPLRPGSRWKIHSKMNQARKTPHVLVLGSCMYVAGGYTFEKNFIFMEMLESRKSGGGWVGLDNPPASVAFNRLMFVSAAWQDEGKLLFGSMACPYFYAYTPASSSWARCDHLPFDSSMLCNSTKLPGVVVRGNSLWLNYDTYGTLLIGLDLSKGKYFSFDLAVEGVVPSPRCRHYMPRLLHLGENNFSLLWKDKIRYKLQGGGGEEGGEEEEESCSCSEEEESSSEEEESSSEEEESSSEEEGSSEEEIDDEAMEEKGLANIFGGYHCLDFSIDFAIAHKKGSVSRARKRARKRGYWYTIRTKATGCLTVTTRRKLIAPCHSHDLSHAFVMNVAVPKHTGAGNSLSGSELGSREVPRDCKRTMSKVVFQACKKRRS